MTRLEDVARAAGVSASTVSRVISRPGMVASETRARVERVIADLDYRPSRVARRLRVEAGRSKLIGLILPDIQNPFFADLARGVEDASLERGYAVFLGNSDEDVAKESRYLDVMRAESVDGVILPPAAGSAGRLQGVLNDGVPVVCVDRRLPGARVDTVVMDNRRGARAATEHLIALGHRRIAFIEGLAGLSTTAERLDGYRAALRGAGIEPDPRLFGAGGSRQAGGRRVAEQLLAESRPTALIAGNSLMTLGALEAIRALGLRVPRDVALVGYDDLPWAHVVEPPLTVVRQKAARLGRRAVEVLLRRLEAPDGDPERVVLEPELVVRGSCGAVIS